MKFAMITAIAILTTGANAADFGTCSHADLHPTDIGYSVSALRLAQEQEHGQKTAPPRPSECGPTSIGYTVSARRSANESSPSYQGESYANSSPSYGSSILDGSQGYSPASNHRSFTASRLPNMPVTSGHYGRFDYPRVAPTYARVAVPIYSPYSKPPHHSVPHYTHHHHYTSPHHEAGPGGPNSGRTRIGGVGSSGKGGHYRKR